MNAVATAADILFAKTDSESYNRCRENAEAPALTQKNDDERTGRRIRDAVATAATRPVETTESRAVRLGCVAR